MKIIGLLLTISFFLACNDMPTRTPDSDGLQRDEPAGKVVATVPCRGDEAKTTSANETFDCMAGPDGFAFIHVTFEPPGGPYGKYHEEHNKNGIRITRDELGNSFVSCEWDNEKDAMACVAILHGFPESSGQEYKVVVKYGPTASETFGFLVGDYDNRIVQVLGSPPPDRINVGAARFENKADAQSWAGGDNGDGTINEYRKCTKEFGGVDLNGNQLEDRPLNGYTPDTLIKQRPDGKWVARVWCVKHSDAVYLTTPEGNLPDGKYVAQFNYPGKVNFVFDVGKGVTSRRIGGLAHNCGAYSDKQDRTVTIRRADRSDASVTFRYIDKQESTGGVTVPVCHGRRAAR